jgi:hypothetical protein
VGGAGGTYAKGEGACRVHPGSMHVRGVAYVRLRGPAVQTLPLRTSTLLLQEFPKDTNLMATGTAYELTVRKVLVMPPCAPWASPPPVHTHRRRSWWHRCHSSWRRG